MARFLAIISAIFCLLPIGTYAQHNSPARDNPTPEIVLLGATQEGGDVKVRVEVRNFTMGGHEYTKLASDPTKENPEHYGAEAQRPNFGHIHVYLAAYNSTKPAKFIMVDKFVMVDTLSSGDRGDFVLKDIKPGRYRLLVELVKHDHSPRLKFHSNDFPAVDMTNITVAEAK